MLHAGQSIIATGKRMETNAEQITINTMEPAAKMVGLVQTAVANALNGHL